MKLVSWKGAFRFFLFLLFIFSISFIVNQPKIKNSLMEGYFVEVVENFFDQVKQSSFITWILDYTQVDMNAYKVNTKEEMMLYKLGLISKGLGNYFEEFLEKTDQMIKSSSLERVFSSQVYMSKSRIQKVFETHMQENMNVLEVSFFSPKGKKIVGVKYKNIVDYDLSPVLVESLKDRDNILIKGAEARQLLLVSSLKNEDGDIKGIVSQTLNLVFFNKILDFLNIGSENLFYLKTQEHGVIVDNFDSYSFFNRSKQETYSYKIYQTLTSPKDKNINLNTGDVEFLVGVIMEDNNMKGNIVSFLMVILIIYFSMILSSKFWYHMQNLSTSSGFFKKNNRPYKYEEYENFFSEDERKEKKIPILATVDKTMKEKKEN